MYIFITYFGWDIGSKHASSVWVSILLFIHIFPLSHVLPESVVLESSAKPSLAWLLNWQARLALTEDSLTLG